MAEETKTQKDISEKEKGTAKKTAKSTTGNGRKTQTRENTTADGQEQKRRSSRRLTRKTQRQEESEYEERTIANNRVSKVVKGGRRFSVSTLVVVGNGRGKIGFGTGKARETSEATRKAVAKAQKSMITVDLRNGTTIYHDTIGHFGSGKVVLRSAKSGTGIIAGGPMRAVFEVLGVEDIVAKSVGSSNPHNMVRATFDALNKTQSPRRVAERRNLSEIEKRFHDKSIKKEQKEQKEKKGQKHKKPQKQKGKT